MVRRRTTRPRRGRPGQDGYQLINRLSALSDERVRRIPAIAVTAYARLEDRERALSSGFNLHGQADRFSASRGGVGARASLTVRTRIADGAHGT